MNAIPFFHYSLFFFTVASVTSWGILYLLLKSPVAEYFKDRPDSRKIHRRPIPRLGGVVIIAVFLGLLFSTLFLTKYSNIPSDDSSRLMVSFIIASVTIFFLGFFDDTTFFAVRVRHKLIAEIAVAFTVVYILNVNIGELSMFGLFSFPLWFGKLISFLWIVGLANAYNIIDGLDGLAGTLALVACFSLALIAGLAGKSGGVVFTALLLSGAITGFLIHNMPPAKTFMGDTGSIFIGTGVAILSLYIGRAVVPEKAAVVMPLIAGIPVIEVLITMTRRYFRTRDKKKNQAACIHSMLIPDNSHIHHRFLYRGYTARQSLMLISMLAITLSCGALCIAFTPSFIAPFILLYCAVPVYFNLYQLGFGGRFKKALHLSPTRYNGFVKSSLIGVIDNEGSLSKRLDKQPVEGVSYIKMSEEDIPGLYRHLRAAVVRQPVCCSDDAIKKAEEISALLRGPVYLVEDTPGADLFVREVSRNGSLTVQEKTESIKKLLRDFQRLSVTERIRHPSPIGIGDDSNGGISQASLYADH